MELMEFNILNSTLTILCFFVSFNYLFNWNSNWLNHLNNENKSLFKKIKSCLSALILESNESVNVTKICQFNYQDNYYNNIKSVLEYSLSIINILPLLFNKVVNLEIIKLPFILFPTYISIALFTLFVNSYSFGTISFLNINFLDLLCLSIIILTLINNNYSFNDILLLIMITMTIVILRTLMNLKTENKPYSLLSDEKEINELKEYALQILYNPEGNGGVQGFKSIHFYVDKLGIVANTFYEFCSTTFNLKKDNSVRPVLLNAQQINYIYPKY